MGRICPAWLEGLVATVTRVVGGALVDLEAAELYAGAGDRLRAPRRR